MDIEKKRQARRVFMEIADLPENERQSVLLRECGSDQALRTEVEALLLAEQGAGGFMAAPTSDASDAGSSSASSETVIESLREGPGTRIGPYKILQLIGEGGFGSVFMADQEKPVSRKVALKIIKLGMDTRQVVARFEQERQALAMMDHPNIARVLDAGATETGRPFFVMELVKGDPIVEYCDKNNLSIQDRLDLFAQVCHAVQHAHTKGIIHRDIKPSNILVSTQDGRPHTKVIDFGIAKATASKLTEKTLFTEHRQLIGTPEYMSPEQAEGNLDIDTRTDVYSLGVLLYELLTGTTPFSGKELRSAAYAEIQRIIREVEPPKPSTRLSTNTETIASVAAKRHVEPKRLGALVRGELDWIVMKALEKDRQRRYETANGLAMDIRRYLGGEAVLAAPPDNLYRIRKFVRRNRGQVVAAGLITTALLLGMAGTAWQAKVASNRAELAQRAEAEAKAARDSEQARASELKLVSDFQSTMLTQLDPRLGGVRLTEDVMRRLNASLEAAGIPEPDRGGQVDLFRQQWTRINPTDVSAAHIGETVLKPAVEAIDRQFADRPVIDAQLRQSVANVYATLGLYEQALPLAKAALATRRRMLGDDHSDTLASMDRVGSVFLEQRNLAQAEACYREALDRRRRVLGEEHPDTLASLGNIGVSYWAQNKLPEAEACYRDVVEKMKRVRGKDEPGTLKFMNNLGVALKLQGKHAEAEVVVREVLEARRRVLGAEHPDTLDSVSSMGPILGAQGKLEEASVFYQDALDISRRVYGEEHPDTLRALNNFAVLKLRQGKLQEAESCWREVVAKCTRVLGPDHPDTLQRITNLGRVLVTQNRFQEALEILVPAEARARRVFTGGYRSRLATLLRAMANARAGLGFDAARFQIAEGNLLEANEILMQPNNATEKDTRECRAAMADLYETWNKAAPGKGYDEKALQWRAKAAQGK